MVKQGVVPDELSKPFWDAANEGRLEMQNCSACDHFKTLQQKRAVNVSLPTIWNGKFSVVKAKYTTMVWYTTAQYASCKKTSRLTSL